jgi:hypothetical protein
MWYTEAATSESRTAPDPVHQLFAISIVFCPSLRRIRGVLQKSSEVLLNIFWFRALPMYSLNYASSTTDHHGHQDLCTSVYIQLLPNWSSIRDVAVRRGFVFSKTCVLKFS